MEPSLSIDLFDVLTDRNPTHWVGIHVCGNYCGIGWCGGHEVQERLKCSTAAALGLDRDPRATAWELGRRSSAAACEPGRDTMRAA